MPRNISAPSLAKLAQNLGTEPITIVEIQWVDDGPRDSFADREISGGIKGKIIEVGGLDNVVNVSGGSQSQQITIRLDDSNGALKTIMDTIDIHKRPCWVYQWFEGLSVSEKFLIFRGQLSSPISWNEGDRTIVFDVISQIEDVEVGFSIEEGDFPDGPEDLVGKPWPLCFGTVENVPALKTQSVRQGILASGVGIRDFTLEARLAAAEKLECPLVYAGFDKVQGEITMGGGGSADGHVRTVPVYIIDGGCAKQRCETREYLELRLEEEAAFEFSTFRVIGGEDFPQNVTITLDIDGGQFTGKFSGDIFTVQSRRHPKQDPNNGLVIDDDVTVTIKSRCRPEYDYDYNLRMDVPDWFDQVLQEQQTAQENTTSINAEASKRSWAYYNAIPAADFFWANPGDTVTLAGGDEILYIANIIPSTILRVAAYRQIASGRQLLTVPDTYYTIRQVDYTGYQVMEIVFTLPLSKREEGWEDDIYVTLTSDVGPNTVDIIEWFIDTYTDYTADPTSFAHVRDLIDNYPSNFALLERKNLIMVLQEIAFQSRCALWLQDDTFYIKYLSEEPSAVETVTTSDIFENTLEVFHTPTEDLVTKYVVEWKSDYAQEEPNKIILRHNVLKYGTHEETYDFYIYNIQELVRKSATFWLIRKANTWRKARFQTPISKLKLEVFDAIDLTVPSVAGGTITTIVEQASYNSDDHAIDFEVWTPLKAGTTVPYDFAWPADIDETLIFPTIDERDNGFAGSGKGPSFTTIAPAGHPLSVQPPPSVGVTLTPRCSGSPISDAASCRTDHGESKPSDRNDEKPEKKTKSGAAGGISTGTKPVGGNGGPVGNCCEQAKRALEEAQKALKEAQGGPQEGSTVPPEEALEKLEKKCGGNCLATVQVTKSRVTHVTKPPPDGGQSSESGATGQAFNWVDTSEECFTFTSRNAAVAFANDISQAWLNLNKNFGHKVGTEYRREAGASAPATDTSEDGEFGGGVCPEPPADEVAMTGYTTNPA